MKDMKQLINKWGESMLFSLLMALCLTWTFTACSDDKDNEYIIAVSAFSDDGEYRDRRIAKERKRLFQSGLNKNALFWHRLRIEVGTNQTEDAKCR